MARVGFYLRLDPELHARITKEAEDEGVSINEFITGLVEWALWYHVRTAKISIRIDETGELVGDILLPKSVIREIIRE